ncbi:QRFP-like peptide receptor [Gigantopelta aegis]|uniref:QRFP-like peptide receptor n=1 Tax=Gigantopelta aegis TaxID=1735272 RepID=UPI001B88D2CD|nr:QRFP-like peptide receptor [Gigantopelta aegis]
MTLTFAIILVLCVAGNLTVILIVALRKDMHTVPNIFITSLSASDLLIGLVALTLTIIQINGLMPFNKASCLLPVYFESVAFTASVYSLLAVTFDRYTAVVLATTKAWTIRTGVRIVFAVWLTSCVYSAKMFFSILTVGHLHAITNTHGNRTKFCNLLIEEDDDDLYYRITDFIVLFVIPIILMTLMYARIARRLWTKSMAITNVVRNKRRIVKFLITNVVLFFFSWLPFYMIDIIFDSINMIMGIDIHDVDAFTKSLTYVILRFVFTVLALSNSVVNPIVYAYFNQNFRMELGKIKKACGCVARIQPIGVIEHLNHIPRTHSSQIEPRS